MRRIVAQSHQRRAGQLTRQLREVKTKQHEIMPPAEKPETDNSVLMRANLRSRFNRDPVERRV